MFFHQDELTCIHQHSHTFPYLPGYSSVEDCVLDPLVGCADEGVKIVSCLNDYSDPGLHWGEGGGGTHTLPPPP